MYETCKSCGTVFEVNQNILTKKIQWLKCGVCNEKWALSSNTKQNLIEKNKIVDWPDSKNDLINLKIFLKEITSNSKYGEAKEIESSINQPWQNKNKVPDQVGKSALARGINISVEKWKNLNELDRFAFCKLVRPSHEHNNLDRAFDEILK